MLGLDRASSAARARHVSGAASRASAGRCRGGGPRRSRGSRRAARRLGRRARRRAGRGARRTAAFDHREHEQAIEQAVGLALADVLAQRGRVVVAEVVRRGLLAARHQLRDLDDVAGLVVREPRHRRDEIARARDSCGSATAPTAPPCARSAGDRRARRRDRRARPRASAGRSAPAAAHRRAARHRPRGIDVPSTAREEGDEAVHRRVSRRPRARRRRCGRRSSRARARTIDGTLVPYNELLIGGERDERARRPDVGGPSRRGDPRRRARVRAGGLAVLLGPRARSRDVRRARRGRRQRRRRRHAAVRRAHAARLPARRRRQADRGARRGSSRSTRS